MTKAALKERQPDLLGTTTAKPAPEPKLPAKAARAAPTPSRQVAVAKPREATPVNMLAVLARAAADPNVNPDKMRALFEIQKEIEAEEGRRAFIESYIALQNDLPEINPKGEIIIKDKHEKIIQRTLFLKFNDIQRVLKPILKKHGFALAFVPEPGETGVLNVVTLLDHKRGYQRRAVFPLPIENSGSKNNVQGWGSSLSYGKRYGTVAILNILSEAKEERDTDAGSNAPKQIENDQPKLITGEQVKLLKGAIDFCGVGMKTVLAKYKIEKLEDLPAAEFNNVKTACQQYADRKAKQGE